MHTYQCQSCLHFRQIIWAVITDSLHCPVALYMRSSCLFEFTQVWMKLISQYPREIPGHGASWWSSLRRIVVRGFCQLVQLLYDLCLPCLHLCIFSLSPRQQKQWILSHCYANSITPETREDDKVVQNVTAYQQNWEWQPACDIWFFIPILSFSS